MNIDEVNRVCNGLIRKYDWRTDQLGNGVRITITDGEKQVTVKVTTGENIESEVQRAIDAVDAHEYGELEG